MYMGFTIRTYVYCGGWEKGGGCDDNLRTRVRRQLYPITNSLLDYPSPLTSSRRKIFKQYRLSWAQSTYIYRVQCMSPRRNWDSPTPYLASECTPPPGAKTGGAHSPAGGGLGGVPIPSDDWRKSLALCLLSGAEFRADTDCWDLRGWIG